MVLIQRLILGSIVLSFIATVVLIAAGELADAGIPMVFAFTGAAVYGYLDEKYRRMSFTFWVFAFLAAAMYYPFLFTDWGFNTQVLVIPMLQVIMFGMGTKLSLAEFKKELKNPKGILIGAAMAFGIMPVFGIMVAKLFQFPPEIAVGVILIGACPGGASSNVMAFLARGNVALSVSITTLTTLLTPLVTPALMKLMANELLEISFLKMMLSSFNLIIVPISAGLICNHVLYGKSSWVKENKNVAALAISSLITLIIVIMVPFPESTALIKPGLILGLLLISIVCLVKVIMDLLKGPKDWMDKILPTVSMVSIVLFVTIVVALNRDKLLVVGLLLVAASALHNFLGFIFGYWGSRLMGMSIRDSRTISIEVALKNGGLGMGLALDALGNANAALAPIVFGKWMNISGSAIANYWRDKTPADQKIVPI